MTIIKSIITLFFIGLFTLLTAQNSTTINGSIALTDETLAALMAQHGQDLLKKGISFEVWSVVYREVALETGGTATNVYFNDKLNNVQITPSIGQEGDKKAIKFMASGMPQSGDFVLLYYFNSYPTQLKKFEPGSNLNDGTNRPNLQYATNVEEQLGKEVKYGVFSIGANRDYKTDIDTYVMPAGAVAFSLKKFIKKIVKGLANVVWEGGKSLAGVVVDATGTIVVQAYGIGQSLVTDDGVIIPRYREMTTTEYNWANSKIFNGTLPSRDDIIITNLLGMGKRQFVWPTGAGKILMNLGKQGYDNPMQMSLNKGWKVGQVFTHELGHVWQISHAADIKFTLNAIKTQACDMVGHEVYKADCGKSWGSYNVEQQATIIDRCYKNREGGTMNTCEETYIEANVRRGAAFPTPKSPECQTIVNQLATNRAAIEQRKAHFSSRELIMTASESPTRKPVFGMVVDLVRLKADSQYKALIKERDTLIARQQAINCQ